MLTLAAVAAARRVSGGGAKTAALVR